MLTKKLSHGCGVCGVYGVQDAAQIAYLALYALQHRGQEASGIVSNDGGRFHDHRDVGHVSDVFGQTGMVRQLRGDIAVGHNRYSTTGASNKVNIQPILIRSRFGRLAISHNGNLTNYYRLRRDMEQRGSIFQTTSDSEIFLHLCAAAECDRLQDALLRALNQVQGAYSIVFLTEQGMAAARDPFGVRPLALAELRGGYLVASETCAFDIVGAKYVRDIEPGEIIFIGDKGIESYRFSERRDHAFCIFEFIYFARPDSKIFGENVDKVRRRLGWQLAKEQPCDADLVISVPDSSTTATLGYSETSGIKYDMGLIRNHYVGRTFIMPQKEIRDLDVLIKFNPVKGVLKGKRVVVVDDSIVRGTTSRKLAKMLYDAGAKEVHMRISSPPLISPCYYGIDLPTKEELIGSRYSVEQIRQYLGVDSLGYLSLEGLLAVGAECGLPRTEFCAACFSGNYPIPIEDTTGKFPFD